MEIIIAFFKKIKEKWKNFVKKYIVDEDPRYKNN